MMKVFILSLFLGLIVHSGYSQRHGLFVGLGMDYTVGGQIGNIHTGIELNRHIFGFMYSKKVFVPKNKYNPSSQFSGITYQFTTYRENHFQLGFMLRAGLMDDKFLVYFPSIMFDFVFNDFIKFNINLGLRAQLPAYGFQLSFNIPFTKNEFPYSIGSN